MSLEKLLTEQEAANYLNISPETLKKARLYKRGPDFVRVGRCIRYQKSDLLRYMERNTVAHEHNR